eukprot:3525510-Pyramimonas_sp.AAC.1
MRLAFSPLRFRWPSGASRWLQDGPRGPSREVQESQDGPEGAPRALQERPESAPRGDCLGLRGATLANARF